MLQYFSFFFPLGYPLFWANPILNRSLMAQVVPNLGFFNQRMPQNLCACDLMSDTMQSALANHQSRPATLWYALWVNQTGSFPPKILCTKRGDKPQPPPKGITSGGQLTHPRIYPMDCCQLWQCLENIYIYMYVLYMYIKNNILNMFIDVAFHNSALIAWT